jgi:putative transposase
MPRSSRLNAPGVLHHVMGRGIERRKIFIDRQDRQDFITRLAALAEDSWMDMYAWALLPNHVLCKTKKRPLSSSMRTLLTGYAVNLNRRHKCHGHLFLSEAKALRAGGRIDTPVK